MSTFRHTRLAGTACVAVIVTFTLVCGMHYRATPNAVTLVLTLCAIAAVASCTRPGSATPREWTTAPLAPIERDYLTVRDLADQVDVTRSLGADRSPSGIALHELESSLDSARSALTSRLGTVDTARFSAAERRVIATMRNQAQRGFTFTTPAAGAARTQPVCTYDSRAVLRADSGIALRARVVACYALAARSVRVGDSTFDRLGVFSRLDREPDPARRRELFLALDTVWRSVNGDGSATSPYRLLLPLRAARWRAEGSAAERAGRLLGVPTDSVERWLVAVLEAWRDATAGAGIEPWDYRYVAGAASRQLDARIPVGQLTDINARYFASLGANPSALNVRLDLAARPGKTAVAYTTFGARPRPTSHGWSVGEPWVFATYSRGGLGNLGELLHETGHAIHIAAIRTRRAFTDWPDSDTWTEALGDLVALDAYEPTWQLRWLGDSVPAREGLRAKYSSVVLDVAWALFEMRLHADPTADPNVVWTEITNRYLHIVRHPEWSWWAMRGQLVDSPGYMLNYALGAMIVADVRATLRARRGDWTGGDTGWYADVSERLYRFGLERPAREVIADFLGRPFGPSALLTDLARMRDAPPQRPR